MYQIYWLRIDLPDNQPLVLAVWRDPAYGNAWSADPQRDWHGPWAETGTTTTLSLDNGLRIVLQGFRYGSTANGARGPASIYYVGKQSGSGLTWVVTAVDDSSQRVASPKFWFHPAGG